MNFLSVNKQFLRIKNQQENVNEENEYIYVDLNLAVVKDISQMANLVEFCA